jgi:ABC-type sugar transport system permease subunit
MTTEVDRRRGARSWTRNIPTLLLFLGPTMAILLVIRIYPIFEGVFLAMTRWNGIADPVFTGFDNFTKMFSDDVFLAALGNSLKLLALVPIWVLGPLLLAAVIHDRIPLGGAFKIAYILPVLVSPAVIGTLFVVILGPDGPLNAMLRQFGLGAFAQQWTVNTDIIMWVVGALLVWSSFGMGVLFYSAALGGIETSLYEAAELDGAGWWSRFFHVTMPGVRHIIEFWTIMVLISVFSGSVQIIYAFSQGGPGNSSTTLDLLVYNTAFKYGNPGYAAAIGMVIFIVMAVLLGAYFLYQSLAAKRERRLEKVR